MANVINGKATAAPGDDQNELVKCDRCGRTFPIKFVYCVCKG